MNFATLALIGAIALLGPLLALPQRWHLPVLLGGGAVAVHLVGRANGQPIPIGLLAAAQLGVPVAAATIGTQQGLLQRGEASALILGALVTIAAAIVGGVVAVRGGFVKPTPVVAEKGVAEN